MPVPTKGSWAIDRQLFPPTPRAALADWTKDSTPASMKAALGCLTKPRLSTPNQ